MKLFYLFLLLISSCSFAKNSSTVTSQSNYNIGFVDVQSLEQSSIFIKDLQKSMVSKEKKLLSEMLSKKSELESQYKLLSQKKNTLSDSSLQAEGMKLEKSFSDLQNLERIYGQTLEMTKSYFSKIFTDKIMIHSSEVADEQKLHIVFPKIAMLYVNEDLMLDITNDVSKKMNKDEKFPKFDDIFNQILSDVKGKK